MSIYQTGIWLPGGNIQGKTAEIEVSQNTGDGSVVIGIPETWDDLTAPATGIKAPGGVSDPTYNATEGTWDFDPTDDETLLISFHIDHAKKYDSDLHPHFHWYPSDNGAGNIRMKLEWRWYNIGDVVPVGWTTEEKSFAAPEVAREDSLCSFADIDGTGKTLSSQFKMKLTRLGTDPLDTYAGTLHLDEVDIHRIKDTLGSATEYVKLG